MLTASASTRPGFAHLLGTAILATVLLGFRSASPAQSLYVLNSATDSVGEYNAATGAAIKVTLSSGYTDPTGVALGGNSLYVSQYDTGRVNEDDATTGQPSMIPWSAG